MATDTIAFALDGVNHVIDLNDDHVNALRDTMDPYVSAARRANVAGRAGRGAAAIAAPTSPRRADLTAIREWAGANGYTVS